MSKSRCDVKTHLACNGTAVRRYKGVEKRDPEFNCCLGCLVYLQRYGVKVKEVRNDKRTAPKSRN